MRRARRVVAAAGLVAALYLAAGTTMTRSGAAFSGTTTNTSTFAAVPSFYAAAVRSDNPASFWRLGESGGTVATDSAGASDATYVGGVTLGAAGRGNDASTCAAFDGDDDAVTAGSGYGFAANLPFTVEMWVRLTSLGPKSASLVTRIDYSSPTLPGNGWGLYVRTTSDVAVERWGNGVGDAAVSTVTVPLNTWTYVAATYDGATLRLYLDGTLAGSAPAVRSVTAPTGPLRIGNTQTNDHTGGLAGSTCDVAVYTSALSQATINRHHLRGLP